MMKEDRIEVYKALEKAVEAFEEYLSKEGYDTSYFSIRFTAWTLASDSFNPLEKIELDLRPGSNGEYISDGK